MTKTGVVSFSLYLCCWPTSAVNNDTVIIEVEDNSVLAHERSPNDHVISVEVRHVDIGGVMSSSNGLSGIRSKLNDGAASYSS